MKRRYIAILLLLAMLMTGCAARKNETAYATSAAAPAAEAPMAAPMAMMEDAYTADYAAGAYSEPAAADNGGVAAGELTQQASPNYGGRKIIRTLYLQLLTKSFDEHMAQLLKDAQTAGGYVQSSNVYGTKPEVAGDSGRNASISLRIPAKEVDAFVTAASGYGELQSRSEDTQDVTDSYFDIETRLSVSRTTLERLENILVKTNKLSDIIELEREIARVTTEIEELTTKLRKYDGMIEYATVNIDLQERGLKVGPAAKTPFGQRISDGFNENLSGLGNFLEDLIVFLLAGLPVLLPIALLVWLIAWLVKRSRAKKAAADGTPREGFKARRERKKAERQAALAQKQGAPVPFPKNDEENKDENK